MPSDIWLAVTALATLVLAGATAWLGWQTRDMSFETRKLAGTTTEELDLLRAQTQSMKEQVQAGRGQLAELREARFAEFLPMLRWQTPAPLFQPQHEAWRLGVSVLLTNEGPGPARLRRVESSADTREDFSVEGLDIPSTLPSQERILLIVCRRSAVLERRERLITIKILYGDLLGEFEYETVVRIEVNFLDPGMEAHFVDSDERSALQRRLPTTRSREN